MQKGVAGMKKWILKLANIIAAIIIISVCVNMFLGPHEIAAGGITGLGIILESFMGLPRSTVVLVFNGALLVVAFLFLGREVFLNTVIGAVLLPIVIGIVPQLTLVNDTMLSMVVGSVLFGVAVHMLYSNNASSGGTAIPPLIFKKYFNLNTSVGLFLTDGAVVILCLLVFSIDSFFFAIFSIFITSGTMSYLENGLNKKKMVHIISEKNDIIANEILHTIGRGATLIPVTGAYSQNDKYMLMVTLGKKDYQQLLSIVNEIDMEAFMITDVVSDVHGRGFTYESGTV